MKLEEFIKEKNPNIFISILLILMGVTIPIVGFMIVSSYTAIYVNVLLFWVVLISLICGSLLVFLGMINLKKKKFKKNEIY